MDDNINENGKNAKEVWNVLNRTVSGISIREICNQLALTFEEVMMAIRWLARDHNIGLATRNGDLMLIGA